MLFQETNKMVCHKIYTREREKCVKYIRFLDENNTIVV